MPESLRSVLVKFYDEYMQSTPKKLKIVDAYLLYVLLTGIVQFVYCCLVGTFPFNSFLAGFISSVGSFVLGVLRRDASLPFMIYRGVPYSTTCTEKGSAPCLPPSHSRKFCLRLQSNPQNKNDFSGISPERSFADFIFGHVILHLVVVNFIG